MIHIKDHKTLNIFDPFGFLGPKRKKLIETSWAKLFRDHILFELPVDKIFKNYQWAMGRPTKELYAMLGVMILQQMHDLTDEETIPTQQRRNPGLFDLIYFFKERFSYVIATFVYKMKTYFGLDNFGRPILAKLAA